MELPLAGAGWMQPPPPSRGRVGERGRSFESALREGGHLVELADLALAVAGHVEEAFVSSMISSFDAA